MENKPLTRKGETKMNWDRLTLLQRHAIVVECGWITHKYTLTKMGLRIRNSQWKDLSEAAQNVIARKFVVINQEVA